MKQKKKKVICGEEAICQFICTTFSGTVILASIIPDQTFQFLSNFMSSCLQSGNQNKVLICQPDLNWFHHQATTTSYPIIDGDLIHQFIQLCHQQNIQSPNQKVFHITANLNQIGSIWSSKFDNPINIPQKVFDNLAHNQADLNDYRWV